MVRRRKKDAQFFKLMTKRGLSVVKVDEEVTHTRDAGEIGRVERVITRYYRIVAATDS